MFKRSIKSAVLIITVAFSSGQLLAQEIIPDSLDGVVYRGTEASVARGVIDGNLIETNFRNHGELSRWGDLPWGVWPRGQGGRHIDGVGVVVSAYVDGVYSDRVNSIQEYIDIIDAPGFTPDTTLNPVIINYRTAGKRNSPYSGDLWGWLPLPGFNNPLRTDPVTLASAPVPALSNDRNSWPAFWPDRLDTDDPGWPGTWNGFAGRLANADLESYYVMDDFSDLEYSWGQEDLSSDEGFQEGPHSALGVYLTSPHTDPSIGGLGLQTQIRLFQWANVLAEDAMFIIYRVFNRGEDDQDRLFFSQIIDYGLGFDEDDDNASYDPFLDLVFGWDSDGIGEPTTAGDTEYELGYTGFAFLESPSNDDNGLDDDLDGIIDESRFDTDYQLLTSQADILAYASSEYNLIQFETFYGETIQERPAYEVGRWFTSDEELDWVGFSDDNDNGIFDDGELLNDDIGLDGLGPFDLEYPGPDFGEADGIPNSTLLEGEPNYNTVDVDESDQIGLTGFDLNTRPFYESGTNLLDDTWLFTRIELTLFSNPDYVEPGQVVADEPFILFTSGEVELGADNDANRAIGKKASDFFSTAWIFGENEEDFFKNRRTVQSIYNSDYNFAQPPITPTFTAVVTGDNQVQLAWDTLSVRSFDRFLQEFDFEGYKLYKGTNNILSDARTITDINGTATFYKPIAQWDLDTNLDGSPNTFEGPTTVLGGDAVYDLGSNTGLEFFYLDNDVINGKTYYYAIVAYDRGVPPAEGEDFGLDPQENVFRIAIDIAGNVTGTSQNAAVVTPTTYAAGYQEGGSTVNLSQVTSGSGTGSASLNTISDALIIENNVYQVTFASDDSAGSIFRTTTSYSIRELTNDSVYINNAEYTGSTSLIDGFTLNFINPDSAIIIPNKTGWIANEGQENELFSTDPTSLDGFTTDWEIAIAPDFNLNRTDFVTSDQNYELTFVNPDDSTYQPPFRFGTDFSFFPIPVFAKNVATNERAILWPLDNDESGDLSSGDVLFVAESNDGGIIKFRYTVTFFAGSSNIPPSPGDKIRISTTRQFGEDDVFQFGVRKGAIDDDDAKSDLDKIFVAPNPYIGAASWERAGDAIGRGERKIIFFNLPTQCTIRIFNIRGELIKTIEHSGNINEGSADWDLKTNNNEDVAYGVYFYHVEAPGIGEYKDKFAIIK